MLSFVFYDFVYGYLDVSIARPEDLFRVRIHNFILVSTSKEVRFVTQKSEAPEIGIEVENLFAYTQGFDWFVLREYIQNTFFR